MRTIVIAPHPDDEVLGVGGTLFRRKAEGAKIAWVIVTGISADAGWDQSQIKRRSKEIDNISSLFDFDSVYELNFPAASLDQVAMISLVNAISNVFKTFEPEEVFLPHPSDVHTDHRIVFDAVASCTKWFRHPYIKNVLAYETLSETDFGLTTYSAFRPNVYVNIEPYLKSKLLAMNTYTSEVSNFPFPRSQQAIEALAALRGAAAGFKAAEAFELLRARL